MNFNKTIFTLFTFILSFSLFAQNFEGEVTFKITYNNLPPEMDAYKSMMPKETHYFLKDNKTRIEQNTGMMGSQVVITDSKNKKTTMLMSAMGNKFYMEMPYNESNVTPEIEYTNDSKDICGYTCKSAEMKVPGSDDVMLVYYTTDIVAKAPEGMESLKGFPLEYEVTNQGMKLTMTATKVNEKELKNSLFEIPEGYTKTTQQELMKMMGGGR